MKSKPQSTERLHEATERLNEALDDAEAALRELNLGVPASVPLKGDRTLHFQKRGNAFTLVIHGEGGLETPVLSASRQMRLDVADRLPALREALLNAYTIELRRVESTVDEVTAFTRDVRNLRIPRG